MLRFASILIAVYMLAHALLPVLPAYVCTDGGRSLNPCSPTDLHAASAQDELHLADCCKLTAPAAIDARPLLSNTATVSAAHVVALLPTQSFSLLLPPPLWRPDHLAHRNPVLRGPPLLLRTVLRI
ncbi:MAG: hypothetical protein JNJ46_18475 [Myxococcales bacterium]|jgi:hypothetical protein|nr:hypothetical protein [Myxococcales bacterium]